jgi:hypothetical protein
MRSLRVLAVVILAGRLCAQTTANTVPTSSHEPAAKQWECSLSTFGYIVPHDHSYLSPTFVANHKRLHLEARYNSEDRETGSLWAGVNFATGEKLVLEVTPMFGGVFGNLRGIAPGLEMSLAWKKLAFYTEAEYVYDTRNASGFLYSWNELTYSPLTWFRTGLVSQRTRAYQTPLDVQRGLLVGLTRKKVDFTTYIFNAGWTDPTAVLALKFNF